MYEALRFCVDILYPRLEGESKTVHRTPLQRARREKERKKEKERDGREMRERDERER